MHPLSKRLTAEALGTFAIVFFGCGSIMLFERVPAAMSPAAIPVVFGLVVAAMIYGLGHISGAHFNPAVTLAFAVGRHFPFKDVVAYWLSQFLGGITAMAMLAYLFPSAQFPIGVGFGATVPHVGVVQAMLWEFIMTYVLMIVIMAVATDTRAVGVMAGAAIGAVVMIDAFVGGWATGASMNPARSLAPALFQSGALSSLWIYFLAPAAGAVGGGLTYRFLASTENGSRVRQTAKDRV